MNRRSFLGGAAGAMIAGAATPRTNILFITADDLGPVLSCYGEKRIRTPHLDRLAASSVRFETAWVTQASCSPSRSSMFTGLYPHGTGQYGLANTGYRLHERLLPATIPNVLKEHGGYRNGIIGKLHVEPESSFRFDFDRHTGVNTRRVRDVARSAREFLEQDKDRPFFLMVNFSDPHAFRKEDDRTGWHFPAQVDGLPEEPISASRDTLWPWQGVDSPEQRERVANYLNAVLRLDAGVGLLLEELRASGREDTTAVIFVGDHGPPFVRGKTTCYEAALHVPLFVRWPGVTRPAVTPAFASTVDIAPTIFDIAGVGSPARMHGRSLQPVLRDPQAPWREYLAGEFHMHGMTPFYPRRTIRDRRYKLIHNLLAGSARPPQGIDGDPGYILSREARYRDTPVATAFDTFSNPPEFELYDLKEDPFEFRNLASSGGGRSEFQRLRKALLEWRTETEDPFLDESFLRKVASEGAPAGRR